MKGRASCTSSRWRPVAFIVIVHVLMVALVPRTLSDHDHRKSEEGRDEPGSRRWARASSGTARRAIAEAWSGGFFLRQGNCRWARLALLSGLRTSRATRAFRKVLTAMSRLETNRAQGLAFRPAAAGPRSFPRAGSLRLFPFNAYYSEDEVIEVDGASLQAPARWRDQGQEALDAARALCPAAGFADHAAYLRRRLERPSASGAGCAFSDFLQPHRRRT